MDRKNENETFSYTYSAKQQKEIKEIREKYLPHEETKLEKLRRLDESTSRPGMIMAISIGIVGMLLLGVGMCCTMLWAENAFILGIVIGVVGILCMIAAHPLYIYITKRRREKLAPQILKLTEELTGKN